MRCARRLAPPGAPEAAELYRRFHCFAPDHVWRWRSRRQVPEVLVNLGRLKGLIYQSDRGCRGRWRTYIHFMERPPILACDPRGTQLYIVGGSYRITRRGIEG